MKNKQYDYLGWLNRIRSQRRSDPASLVAVKQVASDLGLLPKDPESVVLVGGTNGKGSVVFGLEQCYIQSGFRVAAFTSPWLFDFREQIRVGGEWISEQAICDLLDHISQHDVFEQLSYFDTLTLIALGFFKSQGPDVMLLEVGLGGRLDSVNCVDASCAVLTSIALDHQDRLGETRERIATEKVSIGREGRMLICADPSPPEVIESYCDAHHIQLRQLGRDFFCEAQLGSTLHPHNVACISEVIEQRQMVMPVDAEALDFNALSLPGRCQWVFDHCWHLLDVSHNAEAVAHLASVLSKRKTSGRIYAVFSCLKTKSIDMLVGPIEAMIDVWFVSANSHPETVNLDDLHAYFSTSSTQAKVYDALSDAYQSARSFAYPDDMIVMFGSFKVLSDIFFWDVASKLSLTFGRST